MDNNTGIIEGKNNSFDKPVYKNKKHNKKQFNDNNINQQWKDSNGKKLYEIIPSKCLIHFKNVTELIEELENYDDVWSLINFRYRTPTYYYNNHMNDLNDITTLIIFNQTLTENKKYYYVPYNLSKKWGINSKNFYPYYSNIFYLGNTDVDIDFPPLSSAELSKFVTIYDPADFINYRSFKKIGYMRYSSNPELYEKNIKKLNKYCDTYNDKIEYIHSLNYAIRTSNNYINSSTNFNVHKGYERIEEMYMLNSKIEPDLKRCNLNIETFLNRIYNENNYNKNCFKEKTLHDPFFCFLIITKIIDNFNQNIQNTQNTLDIDNNMFWLLSKNRKKKIINID